MGRKIGSQIASKLLASPPYKVATQQTLMGWKPRFQVQSHIDAIDYHYHHDRTGLVPAMQHLYSHERIQTDME